MAKYRVTAPDGKTFEIEGDGTAEEALAHFQANYKPAEAPSWSQVPREAIKNAPASAMNFASGMYNAVRHPIDTVSTLLDAGAGALRNILPSPVSNLIDKADWNPDAAQRASNVASAVGDIYKNRYGSSEGLRNTIATDPVGVAGDLSAVLGGFSTLMPKGAAATNAMSLASKYTNPLTPAIAAGRGAVNLTGNVAAQFLGATTGAGAESVKNAYRAGAQGGTEFWSNMTGKVPMPQVIESAKAAILNMKNQRSAAYRSGMVDISKDASQLDFGKIDAAIREAKNIGGFKGQVTNPNAAKAVSEMSQIFDDWMRLDPKQFHTPEGFDALKQKLGSVLETIPHDQNQARLAAGKIYNAAKQTIVEQAPAYAKVMKDYSEASDLISEIQRAFSLKETASVDTALRKLQSLTRNNVSTNYGNRLDLANKLATEGGYNPMPALSGQALSSWTPRGLQSLSPTAAVGAVAAGANPAVLGLLPASSPRLVGSAAFGLGAVGRMVPGVPDAALLPALLMQRAANLQQP